MKAVCSSVAFPVSDLTFDSEGPAVRKAPQNVADAPFLRRERDVAAVRLLDPHVPVLEGEDTVISEVLLCEVMWVV